MRKRLGLITICIYLVLGVGGVQRIRIAGASMPLGSEQAAEPSSVPMSVLWSQIDPERQTVTFAVQNVGTKVITAWDVTIVAGTPPDVKYGGHGVDAFRQYGGVAEGRSYIVPNGSATATTKLPSGSASLVPVVVIPSAAIFADNSFTGDAKFAQLVFERRTVQLEAWREILGQLDDARRTGGLDVATLDLVVAKVNASIAQKGADIVRTTFRANLAIAIADVRAGKAQAATTWARFLAEANQNVAVATAHSRR